MLRRTSARAREVFAAFIEFLRQFVWIAWLIDILTGHYADPNATQRRSDSAGASKQRSSVSPLQEQRITRLHLIRSALAEDNFEDVLSRTDTELVQSCVPLILSALVWAPPFLYPRTKERAVAALRARSVDDPSVGQALGCALLACGKDARKASIEWGDCGAVYDAGLYFDQVSRRGLTVGSHELVPENLSVLHPFVSKLRLKDARVIELNEAADTLSLQLESTRALLKKGDLRRDAAIAEVFRYITSVWRERSLRSSGVPISARILSVVAVSPECGLVDLEEHRGTFTTTNKIVWSESQNEEMAATAAGAFVAAWLLHECARVARAAPHARANEFVVDPASGAVSCSELVSYNDGAFPLSAPMSHLRQTLGPKGWHLFTEAAVKAFVEIRLRSSTLTQFADIAFRTTDLAPHKVVAALEKAMWLDSDLGESAEKFRRVCSLSGNTATDLKARLAKGTASLMQTVNKLGGNA